MQTYTFSVNSKKINIKADRPTTAMDIANHKFESRPQGVWMEGSSKNSFYWALGNFFD